MISWRPTATTPTFVISRYLVNLKLEISSNSLCRNSIRELRSEIPCQLLQSVLLPFVYTGHNMTLFTPLAFVVLPTLSPVSFSTNILPPDLANSVLLNLHSVPCCSSTLLDLLRLLLWKDL